jgi:hypothetical protein
VITIIAVLYALIIYPSMLKSNLILIITFLFWLIGNIVVVLLVAGGGIMVNHYVSI